MCVCHDGVAISPPIARRHFFFFPRSAKTACTPGPGGAVYVRLMWLSRVMRFGSGIPSCMSRSGVRLVAFFFFFWFFGWWVYVVRFLPAGQHSTNTQSQIQVPGLRGASFALRVLHFLWCVFCCIRSVRFFDYLEYNRFLLRIDSYCYCISICIKIAFQIESILHQWH